MRVVLAVFMVSAALCAQDDKVYRIGNGVSMPSILSKVEPEYTEEARLARVNANVTVALVVGVDGGPRDLKVTRGSGFGLDEKALEAVRQWRLSPGLKAGTPVAVFASVEVNFRLLKIGIEARLAFTPSDASRPVLKKGRLPDFSAPAPVTFHFTFDVNEHGAIENLNSADPAPDHVLAELRKLQFQPAMANGQPVRVAATLELSYHP